MADHSQRYIVTFTDISTEADINAARERAQSLGGQVVHDYSDAIRGFAAVLTSAARADLQSDPAVDTIAADEVVSLFEADVAPSAPQSSVLDSLDRIDQRSSQLDGLFRQNGTGEGVRAYVVDTGIADHDDFGDRVMAGFDVANKSEDGREDCNGHGTHVAGTLGGRSVGVAKEVTLIPVRVFRCSGSTGVSDVIAGIDWATAHHKRRGGPAVLNLSLGVPKNSDLDDAVQGVIAAGITVVAAAGNGGGSACKVSPARVPAAITVGAVWVDGARAEFSNVGSCVDLFAPGVNIWSADAHDSDGFRFERGTSMAAPHVAGAVAAYLQNVPKATPGSVRTVVIGASTKGILSGIGSQSPNRFLYSLLPTSNRAPNVRTPTVSLPGAGGEIRTDEVPVKVSWSGSDPDGHRISTYRVQRSYDGGETWRTVETVDGGTESVKVWTRPQKSLRLRVRATDEFGKSGHNARTATMRLALLQESAAELRSSWQRERGKKLSGGAERIAGREGATLTLTFTGSRIRWIGSTGRDRGRAKVYLDGKHVATVDTYTGERAVRQVLFGDSLKPGRHTLRIVLTGTERAKASGSKVAADAFIVLD
ncbi:MAG: S8 family serine peptidase [Sporichthyaceae bacterium]